MRVFPRGDEARELPVVENQEHRCLRKGGEDALQHGSCCIAVDAGCRLVEQQDFLLSGVFALEESGEREGDEQALALPAREAAGIFAEPRALALRQVVDDGRKSGELDGAAALIVRETWDKAVEVLADRAGKKHARLRRSGKGMTDVGRGKVSIRMPRKRQHAAIRLPEARQEMEQRRLPRAALAEKKELFAGRNCERKILKERGEMGIGEREGGRRKD